MRILLITQNERLFLPQSIHHLISRLSIKHDVVAAIVFETSPFGGRKNLVGKFLSTLKIFGVRFVLKYALLTLPKLAFGADVRSVFNRNGISILKLNGSINADATVEAIRGLNVDLAISVTGNQVFKRQMFETPRLGTLNLHSALLPKYRGLMPTFWALKHGEVETGVSVFFVDDGIDSGPIVVQKKIKISSQTQWELIQMTKALGMEAIVEAVELIAAGNSERLDNLQDEATYFSFPTREDVRQFKAMGAKFF